MRTSLLILLAAAGCVARPAGTPEFEERLLITLIDHANVLVPVAFSRDGRHAAVVLRTPEGDRAILDDRWGRPFELI